VSLRLPRYEDVVVVICNVASRPMYHPPSRLVLTPLSGWTTVLADGSQRDGHGLPMILPNSVCAMLVVHLSITTMLVIVWKGQV